MKIIRTHFIILLNFYVLVFGLFSNNITIEGRITAANKPLKGANVFILQSNVGTISNVNGEFSIIDSKINNTDTLVVSFIGFKNDTIPLIQYNGPRYFLSIELTAVELQYEESIQVTADRLDLADKEIPHSSTEISASDIEKLGSSDVVDYLKTVSAVEISGNELSGKFVEIRGSDRDEVNVYVDGVLINNLSVENVADLSIFSAENIEKLEVLKGANLTLLGQGAFGGVINITTRKKSDFSILLKSKIGQLDSRYFIADVNVPITENIVINYFGQYNELSPEIEYFSNERFEEKTKNNNIHVNRQNHNLSLHVLGNNGILSGKILSYFLDYEKPFWKSNKKNYILAFDYNGKLFSLDQLNISASQLYSEIEYDRQNIGSAHYLDLFETRRTNLRIAKGLDIGPVNTQFAAEYYHDELSMDSRFKDISFEQKYFDADLYDNRMSVAAVLNYNKVLDSTEVRPWNLYAGFRGDFLANGREDYTNSIGVSFNRDAGNWQNQPYVNIGNNIKYPTLFENAFLYDIANLSNNDSSLNILQPEYNTSIELGLLSVYTPNTSFYENLKIDLSFFTRKTENKLIQRPFDDAIYEIQNGKNTTLGYEASISLNNLYNRFSIHTSHLWLSVTNPLLYSYKPKIKFNFQVDFSTEWGMFFTTRYFYEGESFAWYYDNQNQFTSRRISPFFDIDISLGYKFKFDKIEISWIAAGYNILDNSGYLYYYLKKRYLHSGISIKY